MTITCDTPIESLLNVNEVEEKVDEYLNTVTKTTEDLLTMITYEQTQGLSEDAFTIDGDSLIYNKSQKISFKISTIEDDVTSWKSKIIATAEEKRKEELDKLKLAVYRKLLELSATITQLNFTRLLNDDSNITSQLEDAQKSYEYYKDKSEQLENMKE